MATSGNSVNIQFEDKALKFIQSRRLQSPAVLVNMATMSGGGACDGGGGCGGGNSNSAPCLNVMMVDGNKAIKGFVKVDTQAEIPVYLARSVFDFAQKSDNPLFITLKGLVMKSLSIEGFNFSVGTNQKSESESDGN